MSSTLCNKISYYYLYCTVAHHEVLRNEIAIKQRTKCVVLSEIKSIETYCSLFYFSSFNHR